MNHAAKNGPLLPLRLTIQSFRREAPKSFAFFSAHVPFIFTPCQNCGTHHATQGVFLYRDPMATAESFCKGFLTSWVTRAVSHDAVFLAEGADSGVDTHFLAELPLQPLHSHRSHHASVLFALR